VETAGQIAQKDRPIGGAEGGQPGRTLVQALEGKIELGGGGNLRF
jgi:hypothetical protein